MRIIARLVLILGTIMAHSFAQAQNLGGNRADEEPTTYLSELNADDTGLCILDIDGDGSIDPAVDGSLGLESMSGGGSAKTPASRGAKRRTGEDIKAFLRQPDCQKMLDINMDGQIDADTDGKILSRWLNGTRGPQLVEGVPKNKVGQLVDPGAVDSRLSFYRNPRRQFSGWIPPGETAGMQDTHIKLTSKDTRGAVVKVTIGKDDQGIPVYEVESNGGEVMLALGDPNQYASLLESDASAAALSEDNFPGYQWLKKYAWFAAIGPGLNRYPGPVNGDANTDGNTIVIPPDVYPVSITLTAKPSFQLMTACSTPQDLPSCFYTGKEAVLFVHGYQPGSAITVKDYWGDFPRLMDSEGYVPFDFRWSTSARFEDVAADLAFAIEQITARTNKQVHIVAHSFGGLLTRTLLQGLAANGADVAGRVAGVTTLGTPHSGIMDKLTCRKEFGFPQGQDASFAFEGCGGLACHEMGEDVFTDLEAKFFQVNKLAGGHAVRLSNTLTTKTSHIPLLSMIGVTMWRGKDKKIDAGDDLISFQGQRFMPEYSASSTGCESISKLPVLVDVPFKTGSPVGPFTLREQYLGDFIDTDRPGQLLTSDREGGYRHSTSVLGSDPGEFLSPPPAENFVECDTTAPGSCVHDGFIKARYWVAAYPAAKLSNPPLPGKAIPLNDTGITFGGNSPSGNNAGCTGVTIAQQDCSHGRDATHNDNSDGHAGFSYTKLSSNGSVLPASATSWACVRDNVTGLVWEMKTNDGGIHDKDKSYRWGGKTAQGSGYGYYHADWNVLVDGSNNEALCGFTDWRVPTRQELQSIVNYNRFDPAIDTAWFPNPPTLGSRFWSASPSANYSLSAWFVDFDEGYSQDIHNAQNIYVRLVRAGQPVVGC